MKLVAKELTNPIHFWVEDYNEDDKEFFETFGFEEKKARGPASFGFKSTLEFKGSQLFGLWTKEESGLLCAAVKNFYAIDPLKNVEIMDPYL